MRNDCSFSDCRKYRYSLLHRWDELFERRRAIFVCLNPSTADENQLDPTLRRIKAFSERLGASEFLMLNIFAYRATDPKEMMAVKDPVGPENDARIQAALSEAYELNGGAVRCDWWLGQPRPPHGASRCFLRATRALSQVVEAQDRLPREERQPNA